MPADSADEKTRKSNGSDKRTTILEVFGFRLNVANPHLAEVLTMDAKEALTTDVRDLAAAAVSGEPRTASGVPPAGPVSADPAEHAPSRELECGALGRDLGFDVDPEGLWVTSSGVIIMPELVEPDISYAHARDVVLKNEAERGVAQPDYWSVLYIASSQPDADVMKVALRQSEAWAHARVASSDSLLRVTALRGKGALEPGAIAALLAPVAAIDVADLLGDLNAARSDD